MAGSPATRLPYFFYPCLPKQTKPNKPKNLPKKTSNPNQSNKIKPTKSIIIKFISQIIKSKLFYSIKISKNLIKLNKSKNALSLAQLSPNLFYQILCKKRAFYNNFVRIGKYIKNWKIRLRSKVFSLHQILNKSKEKENNILVKNNFE